LQNWQACDPGAVVQFATVTPPGKELFVATKMASSSAPKLRVKQGLVPMRPEESVNCRWKVIVVGVAWEEKAFTLSEIQAAPEQAPAPG